jgi:hypothetical protein
MKHIHLIEIECSEIYCIEKEKFCQFLTRNPNTNEFYCLFFAANLEYNHLIIPNRSRECKSIFKRIQ